VAHPSRLAEEGEHLRMTAVFYFQEAISFAHKEKGPERFRAGSYFFSRCLVGDKQQFGTEPG
jgi:hypothetical protein